MEVWSAKWDLERNFLVINSLKFSFWVAMDILSGEQTGVKKYALYLILGIFTNVDFIVLRGCIPSLWRGDTFLRKGSMVFKPLKCLLEIYISCDKFKLVKDYAILSFLSELRKKLVANWKFWRVKNINRFLCGVLMIHYVQHFVCCLFDFFWFVLGWPQGKCIWSHRRRR